MYFTDPTLYSATLPQRDFNVPFMNPFFGQMNMQHTLPWQQFQYGTLPWQQFQYGALPWQQSQYGALPWQQFQYGALPFQQSQYGNIPMQGFNRQIPQKFEQPYLPQPYGYTPYMTSPFAWNKNWFF
jgi:hypothetical protein